MKLFETIINACLFLYLRAISDTRKNQISTSVGQYNGYYLFDIIKTVENIETNVLNFFRNKLVDLKELQNELKSFQLKLNDYREDFDKVN